MAEAQLPSSKGTAYTVPAGKGCIVSSISLVNTDTVARTVNIYLKKSGSVSRRVCAKDLSLAAGARYTDTLAYALSAGDIIEWDASAATIVDGVVTGTEYQS